MYVPPSIIVTHRDLERLRELVAAESTYTADKLDGELTRARVVAQTEIERDVVTMNSDVVYKDFVSGTQRTVRVVYPEKADATRGWVSVLAPLGAALLGLRVGQEIEWRMPSGIRRVRVLAVPYQPEANGDYEL